MSRIRTLVALAVLALAVIVAPAANARHAVMKAHYAGPVTKVNMGNHSFNLKNTKSGKVVLIYVNAKTKYIHVKFDSLKKNTNVGVQAVLRESDHTWWATEVAKM